MADTLRALINGFDGTALIESAWTPPSAWYTNDELYRLELTGLFGDGWQPVARDDDVPRGGYTSGCVVGEPWVLCKNSSGEVSAFHNTCRHRGREVVTGSGRGDDLVCGYHGWRYDLSGRLTRAPKMAGICDFDRAQMSLPPLAAERWGPWWFVNISGNAPPLAERFAGLTRLLDETGWSGLRFATTRRWNVACNWKVFVDNYLDGGYHIPHMHPTLDAQLDMSSYRTEMFDWYSIQSASSRADHTRRIGERALYAWLFPNFMVNRYGPCLDSNLIIPRGPDRCEVVFDFYFDEHAIDDLEQFVDHSVEQACVTQGEDIEICESVQRGLASRSYDRGRYAPRHEQGEFHFHRLLADQLHRALDRR